MPTEVPHAVPLAFTDLGEGPAVLLIHGFASTGRINWIDTGWVKALVEAGFRAIVIDNRGHGDSPKFYRTQEYSAPLMAADALAVLDQLGIERAHVLGYSMGARIAVQLALSHGGRVNRVVLGGMATNLMHEALNTTAIADAMLARSRDDIADPGGRVFRIFAEQTGSDLAALAACILSVRSVFTPEQLLEMAAPVLVVAGSRDDIAGPLEPLRGLFRQGTLLALAGRNHMNAVGDTVFKNAAVAFFQAAAGSDAETETDLPSLS